MNTAIKQHPVFGKSLYADNGCVEIIIPLEFGVRIGHFSFCGDKNMFFEQPKDMTDLSTPVGWRVHCGHRIWLAPESPKDYCPDNAPIEYQIFDDAVEIYQQEDPWLHVKKSMRITFLEDAKVVVENRVENTGEETLHCSVWAITSVAPGGVEDISFALRDGGYDHWHRISMWDYTSLGDDRAEYRRDGITLTHRQVEQKYKIGVGHPSGPVRYANNGVVFVKDFPIHTDKQYPDADVSFETFMCKHMVEIESLSPLADIAPGTSHSHKEVWHLLRK